MKSLIAGNWKMNGLGGAVREIVKLGALMGGSPPKGCEVLICPPATLIASFASPVAEIGAFVGGQDCHPKEAGAHTGDISAEMLRDAGAAFVIVGHSERRADHGETDALVRDKAAAAHRAELTPIICVGETESERKAGEAERVVGRQLEGSLPESGKEFVVAYEPVWAIGTGLTPTIADIDAMHRFIRNQIGARPRILYGGSVKPANAREILSVDDVNGALVGGASLKADDFFGIISAV